MKAPMIGHIIKQFLFEQKTDTYKAVTKTASSSDKLEAKRAGGEYAFIVKIILSNPTAKISDRQARMILSNHIKQDKSKGNAYVGDTSKYANGNYIYLASNPLTDSAKRLTFNVWILNRQELKDIAVSVQDREKMKGFFFAYPTSIDFGNITIGNSPIMSYDDMAKWFSILTVEAKKKDVDLSLPDIKQINTVETSLDTTQYETKLVVITDDNYYEYPEAWQRFRGNAKVSYSTNGQRIIIPIEGRLYSRATGVDGEIRKSRFIGTFKNGVPSNGVLEVLQLGVDASILNTKNEIPKDEIYTKWTGDVSSTVIDTASGPAIETIEPIVRQGKYDIKPRLILEYTENGEYQSNIPGKLGTNRIYYLDSKTETIYSVSILKTKLYWFSMTQNDFEAWIHNPTEAPLTSPITDEATTDLLNKRWPEAFAGLEPILNKKLNTPIQFKNPEVTLYKKNSNGTFEEKNKLSTVGIPNQYWLDVVSAGYTNLVGTTKDPSKSYWVKSDQIK
jgi:hypothetical protein